MFEHGIAECALDDADATTDGGGFGGDGSDIIGSAGSDIKGSDESDINGSDGSDIHDSNGSDINDIHGSDITDDEDEGELLHPFVEMEAEEADSQSEGSNDSVASNDAKMGNEQANVHVAERDPHLCAVNCQWNQWWQRFDKGVEVRSHICERESHSRIRKRLRTN